MTLRVATQWNDIQAAAATVNNTGTKPNFAARIPFCTGGGDLKSLALSFYNWYLKSTSAGELTITPNGYEITGANIEFNGVVVPLTFAGQPGRVHR